MGACLALWLSNGPPAATSSPSLLFRMEVFVLGILALLLAVQAVGTARVPVRDSFTGGLVRLCFNDNNNCGIWLIGTKLSEKDAAL